MLERLLSPVRVGGVTLKNRVMQLATTNNLDEAGRVGDRLIAFWEARARGGVGSIVTNAQSVHPSSQGRSAGEGYEAYREQTISGFQALAKRLHEREVRVFGQLIHTGRQHHGPDTPRLVGPSDVGCLYSGGLPHRLDPDEIRSIISGFVQSAANLQEAGLDGVEVHAGQGYLLQQFLSPASNRRDDEYGGSLENRLRLTLAILTGIRRTCKEGFVIGLRLGVEEFAAGGLHLEESMQAVRLLVSQNSIDYISVTQGNFESIERHAPDRHFPPAPYVHLAAAVRSVASGVPVVACGRILDPDRAQAVLEEGQADLIGLCRPLIADPDWVRKAARGEAGQIRRCISCNSCWGSRPIKCVVNPLAGRELEMGRSPEPAAGRRVVVVGGGPAGLEAARTAALRGHHVTLFEARANPGGAIAMAGRIDGHEELASVAAHLGDGARRAGVEMRLGREATVADVLAERPEAVVIATGAADLAGDPELSGQVRSLAPSQALDYSFPDGSRVVILDQDGYYEAPMLAQHIARRGVSVFWVTPHFEPGREIRAISRIPTLRELGGLGVQVVTASWLRRIEGSTVVLAHRFSDQELMVQGVSHLMRVGAKRARDELYAACRQHLDDVRLVGDAFAPRHLHDALSEGHLAGSQL